MDHLTSALKSILPAFGLTEAEYQITPIGTGHIHQTYKVQGKGSFILQRVNKNVFKQPGLIASNLYHASKFLIDNHPDYNFLTCITASDGAAMVNDEDGFPWRMFPYVDNTITLNQVETSEDAYRAAAGFAGLTARLDKVDVSKFRETIPRFQDLALRYEQFEAALAATTDERRKKAATEIAKATEFSSLVTEYHNLISSGSLRLRITHNDTKINNILFDARTGEAVCVIDLDTLMPGYFIYDLGDMVRTFVSPVPEEEKDFSKIIFRKEIYDALLAGYLSEMGPVLTPAETRAIPLAGRMMTYIMAIRFLADYLNGDVYYHTTYPGQNLVRAGNQLRLLEMLVGEIGKSINIKS